MKIGIAKETQIEEKRVPLTPAGVYNLVRAGHQVYVEEGAGLGSSFTDEAYYVVGAKHASSPQELYEKADIIVKVMPPDEKEAALVKKSQIIFSFFQPNIRSAKAFRTLLNRKAYTFGTDLMTLPDKSYPVLVAMSEIAGRMLPQIAGRYLETTNQGRGILLGGGPGVPSASVVILGGGTVGTSAARAFLGLGCQVYVLDNDLSALRRIDKLYDRRVITMMANPYEIEKVARFSDVLIGAVHVTGERTPKIVARDIVMEMKEGAVVIDYSIDHGGCFETSRATTLSNPVYIEHGVIHYCVPTVLSSVARSASHALNHVTLGLVMEVAAWGLDESLARQPNYQKGLLTYNGVCTHQGLADILGIESVVPATIIVPESKN